jgi:hypothetical protein
MDRPVAAAFRKAPTLQKTQLIDSAVAARSRRQGSFKRAVVRLELVGKSFFPRTARSELWPPAGLYYTCTNVNLGSLEPLLICKAARGGSSNPTGPQRADALMWHRRPPGTYLYARVASVKSREIVLGRRSYRSANAAW